MKKCNNNKVKSRRISMKQNMQCFILTNEDVCILYHLANYGAYKLFPKNKKYEMPDVLNLLFSQLDLQIGRVSDYKEVK